jgi:hypothetical protein
VDKDIAGKVIRDAMNTRDKDLGLDVPVAGTIRSTVAAAVRDASDLPVGTRGSIECRVAPSGKVSGCRLTSSTGGGPAGWGASTSAANALAGAALPGQYAGGAIVTIDINVIQQLPAGSKGGLSGATLSFDTANIGAHATRMVRTTHRVVAAR